jgi:hypothetical protein
MGAMTIDGYVSGNPGKLLAPIDNNGQLCGYSAGVENYPYLYIPNIVAAAANPTNIFAYGTCVTSCPK